MPETSHSAASVNLKALYAPYTFAKLILDTSRKNPDRRVSYMQLWTEIHAAPPPYPSFYKQFTKPFSRLGDATIAAGLPYIGALVVEQRSRKHSTGAVKNMAKFIKQHSIPIAPNKERSHLLDQAEKAALLTDADLEKLRNAA